MDSERRRHYVHYAEREGKTEKNLRPRIYCTFSEQEVQKGLLLFVPYVVSVLSPRTTAERKEDIATETFINLLVHGV